MRLAIYLVTTITAGSLATLSMNAGWTAQESNTKDRTETEHVIPALDGPTLYGAYCAVCHGTAADGHGPMASVLSVHVPDLTEISKRNGGAFPFMRVQKIIDGIESSGLGHGTRKMPVWGPLFSQVSSDRDYGKVRLYNLAKYLQTIQK